MEGNKPLHGLPLCIILYSCMFETIYKLSSFFIWAADYDNFRDRISNLALKNTYPFRDWFGENGRTYIPFKRKDVEVDDEVTKVLENNGYIITDYVRGHCAKDGRIFGIGKILEGLRSKIIKQLKTLNKPDEEFKILVQKNTKGLTEALKKFTTSPSRVGINNEALSIVISQNPHDVATMSTDRGWTSCMKLGQGEHHEDIFQEVVFGGLVAYLINSNDRDINNPLARIHIRRFTNDEGKNIAIPEKTIYGNAPDGFAEEVKKWLNTKQHIDTGMYHRLGGSWSDTFEDDHYHFNDLDQAAEALVTDKYVKEYVLYVVDDEYYNARADVEDRTKEFHSKQEAELYIKEMYRSEKVQQENESYIEYLENDDNDENNYPGPRFIINETTQSNKKNLRHFALKDLLSAANDNKITQVQKQNLIKYIDIISEDMDNADISINTREKRDVLKIIGNDLSKNTILNFLGGAKNLISNIQFIPSKKIEEFKSELEEIKVQRTETINNLIKIFYNDVKEHGKTALTGYSLENAFHDLVKLGIDEKTFDNLLTLCFELSKNTFNACNWRVLHSFISYIRDFKIKSSKIDDFIKKMLTLKDIGEELLSAAMSYVYFVLGEDGESFVPIINSIIETASFGNKKNATILDRANKILDVINGTQKYPKNSFWEKS